MTWNADQVYAPPKTFGMRRRLRSILLRRDLAYRLFLKRKCGAMRPIGRPDAPWENAVLQGRDEWEQAIVQALGLGLPLHNEPAKNWDSLAALDSILRRTNTTAAILDAGAEFYSVILPWLFLYGYRNLRGINLGFSSPIQLGPIRYERGDITRTGFKENTFDAVTCLSVIEHGVDLDRYFKEVARILKPEGVVITSTDYFETPIDTQGKEAFGAPIRIFRRDEINDALQVASSHGLALTGPLDLSCGEKTVHWKQYQLDYTFLAFTLKKGMRPGSEAR